ncbi:uncharacterized protein B0H64DRAFT_410974 [Chaetomium fimeti]|uniref:F-box domain-containing protein n=1 Tax=Chaetomium fimeti TaxID=1854472 RepID=A0AAE0H752_9PEZI|nr:hypothetical protein B0H64DRAFT_410974 [Chaetomium fimeti]
MESVGRYPRPAPLETLPLHVFQYVCRYVTRRSLFSLSMASKLCYHAATPQRFSRVIFTIRDKEKLRSDLDRLVAVLSRQDLFGYVRRVVATGSMDNGDKFDGINRGFASVITNDDTDSDGDSDGDSDFGAGCLAGPPLSAQQKQAQHEAWLPFARFLGQLPALTDLVYTCVPQIPPCVVTALHQHHPRCRLHIDAFGLDSLCQKRDQLRDIDPDDFALATSPCLYSVRAPCALHDVWGHYDFNMEALEHIVEVGCAPNLKRLNLNHRPLEGLDFDRPRFSLTLPPVEAGGVVRHRWKSVFHSGPNQPATSPQQEASIAPGRGRLETLVLSGDSNGYSHVRDWNARTDFGLLRRFEYHCGVSVEALETLASIAASEGFRSLRELGLSVSSDDHLQNNTDHLDGPTGSFLQALPPLEALTLKRHFSKHTIEAVLQRHGPTLRRLYLPPPYGEDDKDLNIDADRVREIQEWCPRLEDVELRVRRRQGGPEEVAVYRTLGQIPQLRRATLVFDCRSPYREPEGDAERVRKTLVNLAVDESLTTAIFHEIVSATTDCRLEHLTLRLLTGDTITKDYPEIDYFGTWIGRSWACTRCGTSGEVTVREIDVDPEFRQSVRDELETIEYEGEDVWSGLWPRKAKDWKDDWHSFPLWREEVEGDVPGEERRNDYLAAPCEGKRGCIMTPPSAYAGRCPLPAVSNNTMKPARASPRVNGRP